MQNHKNNSAENSLGQLRQKIDEIDEKIISLLEQRMGVISQVGELKRNNNEKFFIRSNREADMIKDLVKKCGDIVPKATIISIWRKIIAMANLHEQNLEIAIYNPKNLADYKYLVREYYDNLVLLHNFDSSNSVILALEKNQAQIAVFALPQVNEEEKKSDIQEAWWIALANNKSGLKVFAKLPFFEFADEKKDNGKFELVAVAAKEPEKSSQDNSLLCVEVTKEISKNQILAALKAQNLSAKILKIVTLSQVEGVNFLLIELDGFWLESDEAIKNFTKSAFKPYAKILGHFALPIKI
jgi:chorismate mutase